MRTRMLDITLLSMSYMLRIDPPPPACLFLGIAFAESSITSLYFGAPERYYP